VLEEAISFSPALCNSGFSSLLEGSSIVEDEDLPLGADDVPVPGRNLCVVCVGTGSFAVK